jgi:hypothetical protein
VATSITNTSVSTDDLTVDTSTLKVDATNNRVGIGTASPAATLTVAHASGTDGRGIRLVNSSNNQTYETRIGTEGIENTSYSIRDMTADVVRFSIDSSGRVTMPAQPSFSATGSWSYDSTKYWKGFATIDHNIGSHWNNTTGTWTCPIAGRYFIYASVHHGTISTYHLWAFVKNGGAFNGWVQDYNGSSSGENTTASMCAINCAANDTLRFISNGTYPNAYTSGDYSVIGIYLIG